MRVIRGNPRPFVRDDPRLSHPRESAFRLIRGDPRVVLIRGDPRFVSSPTIRVSFDPRQSAFHLIRGDPRSV
jgi:hypothetical protein